MFHSAEYRQCLHVFQGIAELRSDAQHKAMPNEKHIGHRLRDEMTRRDLSVAEVAVLFGVKGPSVYDWLNFGRVAKKHLPKFVEVFGHSIEWWISGKAEKGSSFKSTAKPFNWPFTTSYEVFASLPQASRDRIDAYMKGTADQWIGAEKRVDAG